MPTLELHSSKSSILIFILALFVLINFIPVQASAASDIFGGANYTFTPSLSIGAVVDDNVYWKGDDDTTGILKAKAKLDRESPKTKASASGEWDLYVYMENDDYNRLDHSYDLDIRHLLSQRTSIGISGDFTYDEDYQYSNQDYTEIIDEINRISYSISPNASFVLDEVNTLDISTSFSRRDYLDDDYTDSTTYGVTLAWLYRYSEQLSFSVVPAVSHTELDSPSEDGYYRVSRLLFGAGYDVKEDVNLTFRAGPSLVESNYDPKDIDNDKETNWGFLANAKVKWLISEVFNISLEYDRSVNHQPDGDRYTEDKGKISAFYRIWENLALSVSNSCSYKTFEDAYFNSSGNYEDREKLVYHFRPSLIYRFAEDIDVRLSYQYTWQDDRTADKTSERNRFFLEFTYKIPMDVD